MGDDKRDNTGEARSFVCPEGGYSIFLDEGAMLSFMEEGDFSSARALDHFRNIEAQIEKRLTEGKGFSIMALSVDGKRVSRDFAVVHIAHLLAMHGKKVLIVDCDFLEPGLSGLVDNVEELGFLDIMLYGSSLKSAVRTTGIDGVSVTGPGSFPVSRTVPFALKEFAKTRDFLSVNNDVVIYCSTLHADDGSVNPLSAASDMLLLCCRIEEMEEGQLEKNLQAIGTGLPPTDLICFSVAMEQPPAPEEEDIEESEPEPESAPGTEEPAEPEEDDLEPQFIEKSDEIEPMEKKSGGINVVRLVLIAFSTLAVVFIVWWLFVVRSAREKEGQAKMTELVQKQQDARKSGEEAKTDTTAGREAVKDTVSAPPAVNTEPDRGTAAGQGEGEKIPAKQEEQTAASSETAVDEDSVEEEKPAETVTPAPAGMFYTVHIASFREMKRVGTETDYLEKKGYQTTVREAQVKGKKWFRVYVGEYKTREEADKARLELLSDKRIGYAMIVKLKYVKPE